MAAPVLSREDIEQICRLAETLGVSRSALAFRMEYLGLLDKNLLYRQ